MTLADSALTPTARTDWMVYATEAIDARRLEFPPDTEDYIFFLDRGEAPECEDYYALELQTYYRARGFVGVVTSLANSDEFVARTGADIWAHYCPMRPTTQVPKEFIAVSFLRPRHPRRLEQPPPNALSQWFSNLFPKWGG